jgi:DNA helicase-2/ATP-dependent DNA helicase PcrA
MTAFKSKGMEFAAVFVLAVSDEAWGSKARSQGSRLSLPQNLQYIRYAGATNDERLRLFYVAITRAKSQLYLVSYSANYAGKNMTHLKYLNENAGESGEVISPLLPEGQQQILSAQDGSTQPSTELAAYWQQRHQNALSQQDMQILLLDRLKQFQLSPTHVNDFVDLVHGGPEPFFLKTVLRFPQAQQPEMQFGNAMHETLEWIHKATKRSDGTIPNEKTILKTFEDNLKTKSLTSAQAQQFTDRGQAALTAYISQRQHTISPSNVAEHSFKNEGVFAGQAHLAGKIDKLIINPADKTITIVDYKTGQSHNKWGSDLKLYKYRRQLYLYKALVEGSHTFKDYRVTDAYLEFVEPDEDGVIQELHLSLDQDEYERSKQLAEAIWLRIKSLDLPDVTEYPQNLNGVQLLEEFLLMNP